MPHRPTQHRYNTEEWDNFQKVYIVQWDTQNLCVRFKNNVTQIHSATRTSNCQWRTIVAPNVEERNYLKDKRVRVAYGPPSLIVNHRQHQQEIYKKVDTLTPTASDLD